MNSTEGNAVSLRGISFAYRGAQPIIQDCSLDVKRGRIFALLGPNGSGKTTLLKLIAGALKPRTGEVKRFGRIGYVPQSLQLTFAYSVLDVVLMGRAEQISLFGTPSRHDKVAAMAALSRLGMESFALRSFEELSGGERQLVALARALAADADILVLDEPTSALDLHHQETVLQWISRLARDSGMTVVFSTHHPQHADAVADDVALILAPDRISVGPASHMLDARNVGELFGVEMQRLTLDDASVLVTRWRK